MKNLSGNAKWFGPEVEVEVLKEKPEVIDNRAVLSYMFEGASFFVASDGKPLVFKTTVVAEKYIKKNKLENHEVDNFQDFDFEGIELIEL